MVNQNVADLSSLLELKVSLGMYKVPYFPPLGEGEFGSLFEKNFMFGRGEEYNVEKGGNYFFPFNIIGCWE